MPIQSTLNKSVSIITVNYFCLDEIKRSYQSILKHAAISKFEYIIVSNSPINTEERKTLTDEYPKIKIIQLEDNKGFATANNIGSTHASGDFYLFLNPDTRFQNSVLKQLLLAAEKHKLAGILGPRTIDEDGNRTGSIKNHPSFVTLLHQTFPFLKLFTSKKFWDGHYIKNSTGYVEVLNGSALFISKKVFEQLRGMNETFFMYCEENDLCFRVHKLGYKVLYVDDAVIKHYGKLTTSNQFLKMELEKHRSQKKYLKQHKPHLLHTNRFLGIISYLWRTIVSLVAVNTIKIKQFGNILFWYVFRYK